MGVCGTILLNRHNLFNTWSVECHNEVKGGNGCR